MDPDIVNPRVGNGELMCSYPTGGSTPNQLGAPHPTVSVAVCGVLSAELPT